MKKSVLMIGVILVMFLLPLVLAVQINVKTLPGHNVAVFLRTPGDFDVLDFHQGKAEGGVIEFSNEFSKNIVDLQANVINSNGDYIIEFKQPGVDATGIIDLYLPSESGATISTSPLVEEEIVEEDQAVSEDAEENENSETEESSVDTNEENSEESSIEEVVEEAELENAEITGNVVEEIKEVLFSKSSYYVLGAILGLFVLFFIVHTGRKKFSGEINNFKVVKYKGNLNDDKRIADAESKLEIAKKELDDIRGRKKKLAEAKAKFQKDKEELKKLEGEEE